jgi:hypothetical protein
VLCALAAFRTSFYKKKIIGPRSFQNNFFPPNFSFVFWKKVFWREKILFAKKVIRNLFVHFKFSNNLIDIFLTQPNNFP